MSKTLPTQSQLVLPLIETLADIGGSASAKAAIDELSGRLRIPEETQNERYQAHFSKWSPRWRYPWRQRVHWASQLATNMGLIERTERGIWTLTEKGRQAPHECQPGLVLLVYETPNGQVLWADAISAAGTLANDSLQLIFSSPPYPILRGRGYGTFTEGQIVELIVNCAKEWKRALAPSGSVVLNFKDVWLPKEQTGGTVRSLYQEKLLIALVEDVGLYFADRFYWRNPSHSPESVWVTVKKIRCNNDMEHLFWLGKSPNPYADTREVFVDAKESTMQTYRLRAARNAHTGIGPSGQKTNFEEQMAAVAAGEVLKVIPRNYLELSNGDTHQILRKKLADAGLARHDAMMPRKLANFFIRMLTKPGQTVYDGFFGSGTTGLEAQELGRQFIGSDRSLSHVLGSALRFDNTNFESCLG